MALAPPGMADAMVVHAESTMRGPPYHAGDGRATELNRGERHTFRLDAQGCGLVEEPGRGTYEVRATVYSGPCGMSGAAQVTFDGGVLRVPVAAPETACV